MRQRRQKWWGDRSSSGSQGEYDVAGDGGGDRGTGMYWCGGGRLGGGDGDEGGVGQGSGSGIIE